MANKRGGAHSDVSRKKDEEAYRLLDRVIDTFPIADQRSVFLELVAIGQAIAQSPDAKHLRDLDPEIRR
jgi:hypothetical protein